MHWQITSSAGDEALCSVANVLQHNIRNTDLVARVGGDEFLMIMPNTSIDHGWPVIERMRATIHNEIYAPNLTRFSVRAGITGWRRGDTPYGALERLDRLLFRQKRRGKIVSSKMANSTANAGRICISA